MANRSVIPWPSTSCWKNDFFLAVTSHSMTERYWKKIKKSMIFFQISIDSQISIELKKHQLTSRSIWSNLLQILTPGFPLVTSFQDLIWPYPPKSTGEPLFLFMFSHSIGEKYWGIIQFLWQRVHGHTWMSHFGWDVTIFSCLQLCGLYHLENHSFTWVTLQ